MSEFSTNHRSPGNGRPDAGFTLLELLIAMAILTFGITTLLGVLSVGVGTRRTAEMRGRAVVLADRILHDLQRSTLAEHPIPTDPDWVAEDLAIESEVVEVIDGFPGMRYTASYTTDQARPDLVLVTVRVAWNEQGEEQGVELKRILPRQVPFSRRVGQRTEYR